MSDMTDRARNELKRGIRHKAGLATVEELAGQIKAAAENLPKAAKEAGIEGAGALALAVNSAKE